MKTYFINTIIGLMLLSVLPTASARPQVDELIQSCSELVGVYKTRSEKNLNAALTTSLSEALRAGYCRGLLEEYANHTRGCYSSAWFKHAKFIANQLGYEDNFRNSDDLLRMACNG